MPREKPVIHPLDEYSRIKVLAGKNLADLVSYRARVQDDIAASIKERDKIDQAINELNSMGVAMPGDDNYA